MVQLCVFDLDGTLANTLNSIAGFALSLIHISEPTRPY